MAVQRNANMQLIWFQQLTNESFHLIWIQQVTNLATITPQVPPSPPSNILVSFLLPYFFGRTYFALITIFLNAFGVICYITDHLSQNSVIFLICQESKKRNLTLYRMAHLKNPMHVQRAFRIDPSHLYTQRNWHVKVMFIVGYNSVSIVLLPVLFSQSCGFYIRIVLHKECFQSSRRMEPYSTRHEIYLPKSKTFSSKRIHFGPCRFIPFPIQRLTP